MVSKKAYEEARERARENSWKCIAKLGTSSVICERFAPFFANERLTSTSKYYPKLSSPLCRHHAENYCKKSSTNYLPLSSRKFSLKRTVTYRLSLLGFDDVNPCMTLKDFAFLDMKDSVDIKDLVNE